MKIPTRGFTVVELICSLTILLIISAIAAPSLARMFEDSQQTQSTNQFLSVIHFARSNAVYAQNLTTICSGQNACTGSTQWVGNLLVFNDTNGNGQLDADEQVLRIETLHDTHSWRWNRRNGYLQFEPDGTTRAQNGTFTLCKDDVPLRQLVVSLSGRVRTQAPVNKATC